MADLAALQVSLDLQTAAFERGMAQANASMARMEANAKKTSSGIGSIANGLKTMAAGAGLAAITSMAKSLIDAADAAADTAAAFGSSIDRIYAYNQAMVEAGGKADAMANGLQKLADTVDNAFEGTDSAVDAFKRLGISMDSIKNQKLDTIFERVTAALAKETDEVKRNALAKELLGKSMIGVEYEKFNAAIEQSKEKYKELQPYLQAAADTSDWLAATWKSFTTYLTAGVGAVSLTVEKLANGFKDIYSLVTGKKSLAEAMALPEVVATAEKAAPAINRVAQATNAQKKAAADAAKETEKWNAVIAKQVETQINWESSMLDAINPMRELDRELVKLQTALDSGRITWEQYADILFKLSDTSTTDKFKEIKTDVEAITDAIASNANNAMNQFIDSIGTAKLDFGAMAAAMLKDIAKMIIQLTVMKPLLNAVKGGLGISSVQALGGAWNNGVQFFANGGIVNSPTAFGMAGGRMGVMGEAGAEVIAPLRRNSAGQMGVGATPTTINVINNGNNNVDVSEKNNSDGSKQIDILITQKVKEMFNTGVMDKTMSTNFGARRVGW